MCGRVRVADEVADRAIGRGLARELLALLVLRRGRSLDVPSVVAALWPDDPPPTARTIVHGAVSRLRRALGEGVLPRMADGYAVAETALDVDLWRGIDLLRGGDAAAAGDLLVEPLLGPYTDRAWAVEELAEVRARLGRPAPPDGRAGADGHVAVASAGGVGATGTWRPEPPAPDRALTRLVGRRRELAAVRAALGRSRLVTVVGLGGVGKSRLVSEVLVEVTGRVVRIDLGRGSGSFVERAAGALGAVPVVGDQQARIALANLFEGVDLLVIDGCELDLDGTADAVAFLLRQRPSLGVLATSRTALGVPGEHLVPLLPFEDPGDPRGDAVELLLDRVQAMGVPYVDGDRQRAAAICQACAGVPLAIELAAGELLDSHASVPAVAPARAPAVVLRQRIDDALAGLTPRAALLARRIALLGGGATVRLVEQLGVAAGPATVRELLGVGLLAVEADASGRRFHLADSVRAALLDRAAADDWTAAAGALVALAGPAHPPLGAGADPDVLRVAAAEVENVHGVLRGLEAGGHHGDRLRLARAFGATWAERGYNTSGAAELIAAARTCRDAGALDPAGWAEVVAEYLDVLQSFEAAAEHLELATEAADAAVAAGRDDLVAALQFTRACGLGYRGDLGAGFLALDAARAAADRAGSEAFMLRIRSLLAVVAHQAGDVAGAQAAMEDVTRRLVELGWYGHAARSLLGLVQLRRAVGDRDGALAAAHQGEEHAAAGHSRVSLVWLRQERAELELERAAGRGGDADVAAAREALESAAEVADVTGQLRIAGMCRVRIGVLDGDVGRLAAAASSLLPVDGRCAALALASLHDLLPASEPRRGRLPDVVAALAATGGMLVSDADVATVDAVAAGASGRLPPDWREQLDADLLDLAAR